MRLRASLSKGLGEPAGYFERSIALLDEVGEQYELTQARRSFERYEKRS